LGWQLHDLGGSCQKGVEFLMWISILRDQMDLGYTDREIL